ncbi:SAM-dependent DNA methyltransferase, partial [Rubellimicrobium roseum]
MSQAELKSALWEAASTLRGSAIDRTDWKGYILPLLFFKRISDVWDEETAEAREMYGEGRCCATRVEAEFAPFPSRSGDAR